MASKESVTDELGRLRKSDLVDLIISGKVPEGIKLSDSVKEALKIHEVVPACNDTPIPLEHEVVDSITKLTLENNLRCAQMEIKYVHELNKELRRTVSHLETLVSVLKHEHVLCDNPNFHQFKSNNTSVASNSTAATEPMKVGNTAVTTTKNKKDLTKGKKAHDSHRPPNDTNSAEIFSRKDVAAAILNAQTEQKIAEVINLEKNAQTEQKIAEVINLEKNGDNNRKIKTSKIVGTNLTEESVSIGDKTWIFVSKYNPAYTEVDLELSLKRKFHDQNFICIPLKNNWGFNSFKVGVDPHMKDILLCADVWPKGIEVGEYSFRRTQNHRTTSRKFHGRRKEN